MRHRIILLAVVIMGLTSVTSSSALATTGTYEVSACDYAPEAVNNSWDWTTTDPSQPSHYAEHASCPYRTGGSGGTIDQESGLSTTDALGLANGAPPGTSANWTFTAPTGTTITGITYERYIGHQFDPDNYWSPALRVDGTIVPEETCLDTVQNGETCFVGGPPGEGGEPGILTGLSAHELSLGIVCRAPTEEECVTGATRHKSWAAMYGANITLADSTPPTLNAPAGALWEPGQDAGFHKGTESVTTTAQDIGGGVKNIILAADGQPIETYHATCDYTFAQPCPSSTGPQTLTLPTTQLADGTHALTLLATDAANNQSTIATADITIDNNPPPPPTELTAIPTQAGGSTFTATWTDPPGQIAPITSATYQLCPANRQGACGTATTTTSTGPATVAVPSAGNWDLAVWLTNAAGNSTATNSAHTTITVPQATSNNEQDGSDSAHNLGNETGSRGSGTPPGIPSASKVTIHISASLHKRDLVVHVRGPATGKVRVRFTGRLRGRTVALGVKTVALKRGRLTAIFKLGPRTATHASIRVTATLGHGGTVTETLSRRHLKFGKSFALLHEPCIAGHR